MKPLYIDANPAASVRLDGRALHIRRGEGSPFVVGLRNISQIIASGKTRFTSAALEYCMRDGISIVFLDRHGQVQGFLHGRNARTTLLPSRLAELFNQPHGPRIYRTWWKAMESRARCRLAKRMRIPPDRHRARTLRTVLKRERHRRAPAWLVDRLENRWRSGLHAVALASAEQLGFDATWQRRLWPRCTIVEDIAALLDWELLLVTLIELNELRKSMARGLPDHLIQARILARFEAMRPELQSRTEEILHRLDLRLLEAGLA